MFAGDLVGKPNDLLVDEEIGKALIEKLAKDSAEFSRPLQTAAKIHPYYLPRHFDIEIGELQLFPEQIEGHQLFPS